MGIYKLLETFREICERENRSIFYCGHGECVQLDGFFTAKHLREIADALEQFKEDTK